MTDLNTTAGVREARLYVLTARVSKHTPTATTTSAMGGVRLAASEDEARGSFLRSVGAAKPDFAVDELLCNPVADETVRQAFAALPSAGPAPVVGSVEERAIIAGAKLLNERFWAAFQPTDDEPLWEDLEGWLKDTYRKAAVDCFAAMRAADALTLPEQATADRAGEELRALVDAFGRAAMSHGWESDQGSAAGAAKAQAEFERARTALLDRFQSPNRKDADAVSPPAVQGEVDEAIKLAQAAMHRAKNGCPGYGALIDNSVVAALILAARQSQPSGADSHGKEG